MRPAIGDLDLVMNFRRRCQPPVPFAGFTKRVGGKESFTDAPPLRAVAGAGGRIALILFVSLVDHLLVYRAVAAIAQSRATGE